MTSIGRVVKISGKTAKVKTERPEGCVNCPSAALCSVSEITRWAINTAEAKEGDTVLVSSGDDRYPLLLTAYIFLCPIAILFFIMFLYTVNGFLAFLAIPLSVAFFISLYLLNKKNKSSFEIIKIIPEDQIKAICNKE